MWKWLKLSSHVTPLCFVAVLPCLKLRPLRHVLIEELLAKDWTPWAHACALGSVGNPVGSFLVGPSLEVLKNPMKSCFLVENFSWSLSMEVIGNGKWSFEKVFLVIDILSQLRNWTINTVDQAPGCTVKSWGEASSLASLPYLLSIFPSSAEHLGFAISASDLDLLAPRDPAIARLTSSWHILALLAQPMAGGPDRFLHSFCSQQQKTRPGGQGPQPIVSHLVMLNPQYTTGLSWGSKMMPFQQSHDGQNLPEGIGALTNLQPNDWMILDDFGKLVEERSLHMP